MNRTSFTSSTICVVRFPVRKRLKSIWKNNFYYSLKFLVKIINSQNQMLFNFQKGKREREVFPGDPGVKNLPIMKEVQETWVLSLGQEDPLKKGIAIHSSILAWRISWTEESGGLQSKGLPNSTWLKWISEHECKKKGNHIDHIIIKLMKFIKEKKSLQKLMKTNTVHLYIQEYKD